MVEAILLNWRGTAEDWYRQRPELGWIGSHWRCTMLPLGHISFLSVEKGEWTSLVGQALRDPAHHHDGLQSQFCFRSSVSLRSRHTFRNDWPRSTMYCQVHASDGPLFLPLSPQFNIPFALWSTALLCYNHNARVLKTLNRSSSVSHWYLPQWFLMRNTEYSSPRNTKLSYKSTL